MKVAMMMGGSVMAGGEGKKSNFKMLVFLQSSYRCSAFELQKTSLCVVTLKEFGCALSLSLSLSLSFSLSPVQIITSLVFTCFKTVFDSACISFKSIVIFRGRRRKMTAREWKNLGADDDNELTCDMCNQVLCSEGTLSRHKLTVHGQRQLHSCGVCGKSFERRDRLRRHEVVHDDIKPYQCGECDKAFRRKEHLKRHERLHSTDEPFSCEYCEKTFIRQDYVKKHIARKHATNFFGAPLGTPVSKRKEGPYNIPAKGYQ